MATLAGVSGQYSKKSSAVKRIMQEARELVKEPSTDFAANPLETDIFEWHFTIRGPEETDFEGGLYHGRILLPNNYPFAPPSLMFLTPNGRFELNKKVCLSITGYHPEYWQPAWGIRTVLVAVMGFLPTESKGAIGGLDTSVQARKVLAIKSKNWTCPTCHLENVEILPDVAPENVVKASLKADEMPPEFSFGYEADKKKQQEKDTAEADSKEKASKDEGSSTTSAQKSDIVSTHQQPATQNPSPSNTAKSPVQDPPRAASSSTHPHHHHHHHHHHHPQHHGAPTAISTRISQPTTAAAGAGAAAQAQAQILTRQADSSIPIWLDALILGFGGILVALIIRRFL
ncbi:ubiquitin-conjugating enzyme E2 J1 [Entomortierella parvispora]|uniref:Ubiquitin-conjugating enzyme E2 J1 n=1 Tax=Entomortierella parvispora TaxID=205924 RepID=A0A9P3H6Y7_9FUNG|nr:ubiquitin-conjugating enzyme E2 J1 [Entomortierella parvispora]